LATAGKVPASPVAAASKPAFCKNSLLLFMLIIIDKEMA